MTYVKKSHTKRNLGVILIIIVAVASIAVAYSTLTAKKVEVGVNVGDTFTYKLQGNFRPIASDATATPGFSMYNNTDYYKVTITGINDTTVTMDTVWRFLNGTDANSEQTIDIANGLKSDEYGFWAIYAANLNKGDALRLKGYDATYVNNTDTFTFTGGVRDRCYWFINNQFTDITDETRSTLRYNYLNIFFDRETGMLLSLTNNDYYNNPAREEVITWTLIDSSVWDV